MKCRHISDALDHLCGSLQQLFSSSCRIFG